MPALSAQHLSASLQTEVDAAFLYKKIAEAETEPAIARVFEQLAEIESGHAAKMLEHLARQDSSLRLPPPSWRARVLNRIGKIFGYDYIIGVLMDTEKSIAQATIQQKTKSNIPVKGDEGNHVRILQALLNNRQKVSGEQLSRIEGRHKTVGGNALRAAVLGANDGLVSNLSLVMGVAGATSGQQEILLAGSAGLLAGALSMALEMAELVANPEGEQKEIALIYIAKGIPETQAHNMAASLMQDTDQAHALLIKEELGINPEELKSSAWEAAITSFVLFAVGAIIPLAPFFWGGGATAILSSVVFSTLGLFLIGSAITLFTGKSVWYSGMRQVIFGLLAAAVTFGIGSLIGVSIAG
ncbi:MAG: VIT1/CCC1 transporter family protein [Lewinellaceae bacterium]|nr:VIT1/CCC1 transporter family protein [Lewinellaceae bacterium]